MKRALLVLSFSLASAGCGQVVWDNVRDPSRDLAADRHHCEQTRASELGVIHCLRSLGWDADAK